jgi:SAM-dependent methyltransferase
LYSLTHRGNPGDAAHYAELCRGAKSVLELGCGSGRLLSVLAGPARVLWGLELDRSLLALGRAQAAKLPASKRKHIELKLGDMERFELARRFDRVILPYNALFCLLSPRSVERCFRSARAALEPGGIFGFDVWNADGLTDERLQPDLTEGVAHFEHGGRTWSVFERCQSGRRAQQLDVTYTYVPSRGAPRAQLLRQRYYRSHELLALLERAGLKVLSKHGNFTRGRFRQHAPRLVLTAVAA